MMRPRGRSFFFSLLIVLLLQRFSAAQSEPYRLTLREAIEKGLQKNLSVLVADSQVQEAEGTSTRRFSQLLPRVHTRSYANLQTVNLAAFGFNFPGVPTLIGPFSNYDFRVSAEQSVVDLQSYRAWKASQSQVRSDKLDYQDARDVIIRSIASLYLNGQAAQARIEAAQTRVTASDALYKLARDKHDSGTATGVDVLRAQVQLANDQQALLVAQNDLKQTLLTLARQMGMSPGTRLELAETLQYRALKQNPPDVLLPNALQARADYLSLARQRETLLEQ